MFSSGCCHHIICGTFWAQPAWWVVLHFLLMITHCQCFLPTVFLSRSLSLSFSLLYHSFYCCSAFELSFFSRFLYTSTTSLSLKSLLEVSVEFVGFISLHLLLPVCSSLCLSLSIPFALLCIEKHLYKNVHYSRDYRLI